MLKRSNKFHLTLILTVVLLASSGLITSALSQIVGTKHDLSQATGGGNWAGNDPDNQVCIYCHTPHKASAAQKPLWNRQETQESFSAYSSPTFDGEEFYADQNQHQPQGESKLCMSCHDGVTALNALTYAFGGVFQMLGGFDQLGDVYYPGSPFTENMGPNIGENFPGAGGGGFNVNNLSNDHPISFTFNAALIAQDAHGGPPQLQLPPGGDPVQLFGPNYDQLECSSCHDVHDATAEPFLVKENSGSSLCLTCHLK